MKRLYSHESEKLHGYETAKLQGKKKGKRRKMSGVFNVLAKIVDLSINWVILAGFIMAVLCIIALSREIGAFKQSFEDLLGIRSDQVKITRSLSIRQQNTAVSKREDTYEKRKEFNLICRKYTTLTQLIPLFPLLGILGTVAGLYLQVSTQDAEAIYSALSLALTSTFLGLLAAIILKAMETFLLTGPVNELDSKFEENEIRYSDAITAKNFSEEEAE